MHDDDGKAELVGKLSQLEHGLIIGIVGCILALARLAHHGKCIDDDEAGLGMRRNPLADCIESAGREARQLIAERQSFRPSMRSCYFRHARLKPSETVLKRAIEHVALDAMFLPERESAASNRERNMWLDFLAQPALIFLGDAIRVLLEQLDDASDGEAKPFERNNDVPE